MTFPNSQPYVTTIQLNKQEMSIGNLNLEYKENSEEN